MSATVGTNSKQESTNGVAAGSLSPRGLKARKVIAWGKRVPRAQPQGKVPSPPCALKVRDLLTEALYPPSSDLLSDPTTTQDPRPAYPKANGIDTPRWNASPIPHRKNTRPRR